MDIFGEKWYKNAHETASRLPFNLERIHPIIGINVQIHLKISLKLFQVIHIKGNSPKMVIFGKKEVIQS